MQNDRPSFDFKRFIISYTIAKRKSRNLLIVTVQILWNRFSNQEVLSAEDVEDFERSFNLTTQLYNLKFHNYQNIAFIFPCYKHQNTVEQV